MIRVHLMILMLTASIGFSRVYATSSQQKTLSVEVFTTTDQIIQWESEEINRALRQKFDLQVYELDRIQLVEEALSIHLPLIPKQAKQIALQRIQQLDEQTMPGIQNAAIGLAKAMQYSVDRYPAIVFDGKVVVYGLTDLRAAADYYLTWRENNRP